MRIFLEISPCIAGFMAITFMSYNIVTGDDGSDESDSVDLGLNISWVEERDADGKAIDMDIYFDRVVMICNNSTKKVIATGVLFDAQKILTSYNPFRKYVNEGKTGEIVVAILMGRQYNSTTHKYLNKIIYRTISCQGMVMVRQHFTEANLTYEQWHMDSGIKKHSPVHDLFVIRLENRVKLMNPDPSKYHFSYISYYKYTDAGAMITILAKTNDTIGYEIKFASLGFRNKDETRHLSNTVLRSHQYYDGNVLTDCDEWFIRDWGRFICVKNDEDFLGIGSGSPLIYKNKLYGIGSFTLNKGNVSIFAFTDIRFYRRHILMTCRSNYVEKNMDSERNIYKDFQYDPIDWTGITPSGYLPH